MEDNRIIELYFDRDESAIQETQRKYGRLCLSLARSILGNEEDAAECVNDTYLALWNTIPPQKPDSLMAFAAKLARNSALKKLRFNTAEKRNSAAVLSLTELENALSVEENFDDGELSRLLNSFLQKESPTARNVFLRRYWFFDSISDIGARYSFSESKVKTILHRSRKRLKDYLQKEGIHL